MTTNWDDHAPDWDKDERVRDYAGKAFASLISRVDVRDDMWRRKRVLDFGCGTGLLTEKLSHLVGEVIAVDTSPIMIDVLRNKHIANVTAICADLDEKIVGPERHWFSGFDLVVASSVCGFLPDFPATLSVLAQAMNVSGRFVQWDWLAPDGDASGLTVQVVSNAYEHAGLVREHIDETFTMSFDGDDMAVLMGVARKE